MGEPPKVLIVEDSVVMRRLISDTLSGSQCLEVIGTAANGRIALSKIGFQQPDIVTLDIDMPDMDGLETLAHIREKWPHIHVVMVSCHTLKGADRTITALSMGASDYITKPNSLRDTTKSVHDFNRELIEKLVSLGRARNQSDPGERNENHLSPERVTGHISQDGKSLDTKAPTPEEAGIVAIGCSTGGPNALIEIFSSLREPPDIPVVIVQHMPPIFTGLLAKRLNTCRCGIEFLEAADGMPLMPRHGYVAPGDYHMEIKTNPSGMYVSLNQDAQEHSCRPAVDVLFRSVAKSAGPRALAMVLTGMGRDGCEGSRAIRNAGGTIVVQDKESSVVWGMAGAVFNEALSHRVMPLKAMAQMLANIKTSMENGSIATTGFSLADRH